MMALGSIAGALFTARRGNPNMQILLVGALLFGLACGLAALTPTYIVFGLVLVIVGFAVQTFTTSTNSLVQLSIPPQMRGRGPGHSARHCVGWNAVRERQSSGGLRIVLVRAWRSASVPLQVLSRR